MINLEEKTVLITGGSKGIGKECVKMFFAAGANVAFTYNKDSKAAKEMSSALSSSHVKAYRLNQSDETDIRKLVKGVLKDFKKIDILVNNAGIYNALDITDFKSSAVSDIFDINVKGVFLISREVASHMKVNNYGRIINISSTAAQRGEAGHSHYAATKGALNAFTKSLAVELAEYNITTNAVAPGWVDTPMNDKVFSDQKFKEQERLKIPVKRIATAEDIAGPVLFLASDLARHINGEILNVNGGSVLCG